jgi:hypothetical protein
MARQVTVKVEDYPLVTVGQTCPGLVSGIEKKSKPPRLRVQFRNLHPKQDGRMHEVMLPLPLRPGGITADFFRAVGQELDVGRTIPVRSAVGTVVRMKFGSSADGQVEVVSFEPPAKENRNAAEHE